MDEETFAFGSFRLIPAQRMLLEDGKPLRLGSRALDILVTLVEGAGETIHKDQLIARTWPDLFGERGYLGGGRGGIGGFNDAEPQRHRPSQRDTVRDPESRARN